MNCIPGLPTHAGRRIVARCLPAILCLVAVAACGIPASESADQPDTREYSLRYELRPDPETGGVEVGMRVRQGRSLLREISFPSASLRDVEGDGQVVVANGRINWQVPAGGGTLRWRALLGNARASGGYDAWLGPDWGLFRAEDVIPRARSRALKGSRSRTTLAFDLPATWSAVTEYTSLDNPIIIDRSGRRFDQPTGWIAVGKLGVRRETIAGVRVAIAGPEGQDIRRMDMLALLNWALPELVEILPDALTRLTVFSAGEPMWRGGLSAPASLFVHADRPLISENATSTLLHEVVHTALALRTRPGYDWIAEGLAEYYGLVLLRRGHAISEKRFRIALEDQVNWANSATSLCDHASTGPETALAVTLFAALDRDIRKNSEGAANLDDLLKAIVDKRRALDATDLATAYESLTGVRSARLRIDALPGCHAIEDASSDS